jgi:hypothetical protein
MIIKKVSQKIGEKLKILSIKNNCKYFCIGANKTGTTSIGNAFKELGFVVGNQRKAEFLMDDYFKANYKNIIKYCRTGEVFQDVPFSCPNTFKIVDKEFTDSKFILTIRDSPDKWYDSLVGFHTRLFGNGKLPTWEDLKANDYVYPGWAYKNRQQLFGLSLNDHPYDKDKLVKYYEDHNRAIIEYFKDRPNDLLIINLSDKEAYIKFCRFINIEPKKVNFPWKNKTTEI